MTQIKVLIVDTFSISYDGLLDLLSSSDEIEIIKSNGSKDLFTTLNCNHVDIILYNTLTTSNFHSQVAEIKEKYSHIKIISIVNADTNLAWLLLYGVEGFIDADNLNTEKIIKCIHIVSANRDYLDEILIPKITKELYAARKFYGNGLTKREKQILQHLSTGETSQEIANKLFISPKTLKNHLTKLYKKLGVNNRVQAIMFAVKINLVSL